MIPTKFIKSENKHRRSAWNLFFVFVATCGALMIIGLLLSPLIYSRGEGLWTALTSEDTLFSIRFTLMCAISSTLLATLMSLVMGYALARYKFPFKGIIELLLTLPLVLPPIVLGLCLLILFGPILGESLRQIGIRIVYTPIGIILAQFSVAMPVMIKIFKTAFVGVSRSIYEAANLDGAGEGQVFLKIIVPMNRSAIFTGISTGFARAMGEFGATMMVAGIISQRSITLPGAIYLGIASGDMDKAIALAAVLIIVSMICLGLIHTLEKRSEQTSR